LRLFLLVARKHCRRQVGETSMIFSLGQSAMFASTIENTTKLDTLAEILRKERRKIACRPRL